VVVVDEGLHYRFEGIHDEMKLNIMISLLKKESPRTELHYDSIVLKKNGCWQISSECNTMDATISTNDSGMVDLLIYEKAILPYIFRKDGRESVYFCSHL